MIGGPTGRSHRLGCGAGLLVAAWLLGGCSPLPLLLGAALGGADPGRPQLSGPFGGAPSAVQNAKPSDSAISDALASVDQQVKPACQAMLPPPEPAPVSGCRLQMVCLPGGDRPLQLRICAGDAQTASQPPPAMFTDWRWTSSHTQSR